MTKGFYFKLLFILVFVQHNLQYEMDANRTDDVQSEVSLNGFDDYLQPAFNLDLEEFEDDDYEGEPDLLIATNSTEIPFLVGEVYLSNHYSDQFVFHFSDSSPPPFIAS